MDVACAVTNLIFRLTSSLRNIQIGLLLIGNVSDYLSGTVLSSHFDTRTRASHSPGNFAVAVAVQLALSAPTVTAFGLRPGTERRANASRPLMRPRGHSFVRVVLAPLIMLCCIHAGYHPAVTKCSLLVIALHCTSSQESINPRLMGRVNYHNLFGVTRLNPIQAHSPSDS